MDQAVSSSNSSIAKSFRTPPKRYETMLPLTPSTGSPPPAVPLLKIGIRNLTKKESTLVK